MPVTYWIIGFIIAGVMMWMVNWNNRHSGRSRRLEELRRENDHLRHVVTEMSMERHGRSKP